ncbi:hypothetical protein DL89DRAFT_271554 [Linderina pennispora]|uniref:Uncharacterized protein n=1 Tax=Linderina pennispora TaxID=61395 RepID=A0A1Y1VW94_9FUNG|nr:uncharacterized protein DL89DRAFT_271554 [Linderina pennispora]ORX65024.1 hypothetical protein DL89DRAFT_271554 [Linderina pennispora]
MLTVPKKFHSSAPCVSLSFGSSSTFEHSGWFVPEHSPQAGIAKYAIQSFCADQVVEGVLFLMPVRVLAWQRPGPTY